MAPEVWFLIIMGLVIFNYLFSNILDYLNHKNWKDEIPSELKDFYDKKKYKQAKQYAISKNKIGLLSSTTSFLLVVSLLMFNGYGYIDQLVNSFNLNLFLPFEINNNFIEENQTCDWNLVTFEKDQEKDKIEFIDPYNSIWLKLITVLVYIVELLSSGVCYAFVIYEQDYGHYRTLINQLIGYLYKVVSTLFFK